MRDTTASFVDHRNGEVGIAARLSFGEPLQVADIGKAQIVLLHFIHLPEAVIASGRYINVKES